MVSNGSRLNYVYYSLNSLKVEQDCLFPAELQSFLGRGDKDVALHNCGEVTAMCLIQFQEFKNYYTALVLFTILNKRKYY